LQGHEQPVELFRIDKTDRARSLERERMIDLGRDLRDRLSSVR